MPLPMSAPKHMLVSMPELATQVQTGNPVTMCCLQAIQQLPGPVQLAIQVRVAPLTPADEVSGTAGGRGPGLKCRVAKPSANCIVTGRNVARVGELQSWDCPAVSPQTVKSTKSCRWRLSSPALLAWRARPGCPLAGCVRGQRARARPNAVIGITATSTWPAKRPAHRRRFKPREYTYTGALYPVISLLPN